MSRAGCQLQLKDVNFISCCLCSRSSTKPGASSTEESHPRLLQESQGLEVLGLEEQLWPIDGAAHWCRRLRELREASPADEALRVLEEVAGPRFRSVWSWCVFLIGVGLGLLSHILRFGG